MIKTTAMLVESLRGYSKPLSKISRMAASGEITPIIKGLYETKKETPAYLLAGNICGPSYISFEYALSLPWLNSGGCENRYLRDV